MGGRGWVAGEFHARHRDYGRSMSDPKSKRSTRMYICTYVNQPTIFRPRCGWTSSFWANDPRLCTVLQRTTKVPQRERKPLGGRLPVVSSLSQSHHSNNRPSSVPALPLGATTRSAQRSFVATSHLIDGRPMSRPAHQRRISRQSGQLSISEINKMFWPQDGPHFLLLPFSPPPPLIHI